MDGRMLKPLWGLWLLAALLPAQAQEVYYIHTDALGSPVAETDASRNMVARFEYEPYGRRLNESNDDKPGYTGHVMDGVTGLVQMQQRYYDPGIGVFLSVDPVTAFSNPVGQFHRYRYANNNPYAFVDPDGRESKEKDYRSICNNRKCVEIEVNPSTAGPGSVFTSSREAESSANNYVTEINGGPFLNALAGQPYVIDVHQLSSEPDLFTYALTPVTTGMPPTTAIRGAVARIVTGYTRHGINQAISHAGGGVSPKAILGALREPVKVVPQSGGRTLYVGRDANVVINAEGKVITTYPRSSSGRRSP